MPYESGRPLAPEHRDHWCRGLERSPPTSPLPSKDKHPMGALLPTSRGDLDATVTRMLQDNLSHNTKPFASGETEGQRLPKDTRAGQRPLCSPFRGVLLVLRALVMTPTPQSPR